MEDYSFKTISSSTNGTESTELILVTVMATGKAHLTIKHSVTQEFETKDIKSVKERFERMTGGGGRKALTIFDINEMQGV